MQIVDIVQGSEDWFNLRLGKLTASHALAIENGGKGLDTLCRRLAAEIYTKSSVEKFTNDDMETGIEEEKYARMAYEMSSGHTVNEVGFVLYNHFCGCSPDGLVNEDGGIEIKRKTFIKHNDLLLGATAFESQYISQCHMNLLITDRSWWDLISYNPKFKSKSLFIKRIQRSKEKDDKLIQGIELGKKLIKKYLDILQNG